MPDPVKPDPPKLKIVDGIVVDPKVKVSICPLLAHGPLKEIKAIVMHQTASPAASNTFNSYRAPGGEHMGAHFLIDKDGTIYQTLQINLKCFHVGKLRARCLAEISCSKEDAAAYEDVQKKVGVNSGAGAKVISPREQRKEYPTRYPRNEDSIGIESVAMALGAKGHEIFENPTVQQNASSHWLVASLLDALKLTVSDVYRHPMVSIKMATEAQGVTW